MGARFTSSRGNGARHELSSPAKAGGASTFEAGPGATELAIFNLDASGRVKTWGAAAQRLTGYLANEIVGEHFERFFTATAASAGEPARALAQAEANGSFEYKGPLARRDGSLFLAATLLSVLYDDRGKLAGFAGAVRESAGTNSGDDAIGVLPGIDPDQSRSLLNAVLELNAAAIASCDTQLRVTSWNKGAERIFGYTAREIISQPIQQLITPELSGELDELLEWMRHGEQLRDFETFARRKDGSPVAIILSATPIFGADGRSLGASVLARDISDEESARRKLEQTQRWLRDTVNHAPILITATDNRGIYTMVEGKALSAFGIAGPDVLLGESAFEFMGPDAPSAHATRQALAGATVQTMTEINGHIFEIWKAPQIDAQGRITGTLSVNTDVTRRVLIERELQARLRQQEAIAAIGKSALKGESLERLARRAAEFMCQRLKADLAGVWIKGPDDGDFSILAMTGAMAGEITSGELRQNAKGSLAAHTVASKAPVIASDLASETRFSAHPATLRLGLASAIATPFGPIGGEWGVLVAYARENGKFTPDDANFIDAIAHILTGASANAESRQKLQRSEAYFRRLIENTSDVLAVVDPRGIIRFVGGAVEPLFGTSSERLSGTASIDLIAPEGRSAVRAATKHAFDHPGEMVRVEFTLRPKGLSWIACEAVMKAVADLGDEVMLVVSSRDVSERKRQEEAIAQARDAALEAVRLKSAFLANMSHEVRTPVNIIMGYTDMVAQYLADHSDESQNEFLTGITRAGRRLLQTIDAILDYSKLSAKSLEMSPEMIRLGLLVEGQIRQMEPAAQAKNLLLAYVNEAADAEVWCDEYCLTRSLHHLLDNAIKFTQQGEVRVHIYRDQGDAVRADISDTGIGIDPAFLPRLLEPFSQEDAGFSRRFEGTGLGLALAKGYLESNGARLVATSEKGAGSTFSLIFARAVDCSQQMTGSGDSQA